jgi:hypothetical protein
MANEIWIDPTSHWKAAGAVQPDGSMTNATVDDNNGTTRDRGVKFSSKQDFISWVRRHTN